MFEVVVATAFYSGICYMVFESTGVFICPCHPCCVMLGQWNSMVQYALSLPALRRKVKTKRFQPA
jgi:hypothetical protein